MTTRVTARSAVPARVAPSNVGPRTWLIALLAAISTFDPGMAVRFGPYIAIAVMLTGRPSRMRINAPVLLSAAFLAWVFMSQAWSRSQSSTVALTVLWAQLLVVFIATLDLLQTRAQVRLVAGGYIAGAFFAVAKILITDPAAASSSLLTGERLELGNANINYVAYGLSAGFALVVLLWMTRRKARANLLPLALGGGALIIGINLSGTRGAFVGLVGLIIWLLLSQMSRRPPIRLLVILLIAAQACILTGIADQASLAYEFGGRATGDWSGRLTVWPEAREVWSDNFFLGVGAGAFNQMSSLGIGAHNMVLHTGAGLGVVGVLLLVAIIWASVAGKGTADAKRRLIVVGSFLATSAPAYLSGVWETAPASWIVLAIISRVKSVDLDAPIAVPGCDAAVGRAATQPFPDLRPLVSSASMRGRHEHKALKHVTRGNVFCPGK